jgi:hypothetical protein
MVTCIPEIPLAPDICGTLDTPCGFLLPLRIGEQESIHLMEILQLAQRLDRILVLPNVGKSHIGPGTCFKSGLATYYLGDWRTWSSHWRRP